MASLQIIGKGGSAKIGAKFKLTISRELKNFKWSIFPNYTPLTTNYVKYFIVFTKNFLGKNVFTFVKTGLKQRPKNVFYKIP